MAFLDFMKGRPQRPPEVKATSQTPTPEPKPMKPENLPDTEKAKMREAVALLNKATQHVQVSQPSAGEGGTNTALLQKQNSQDKVQAALSPTDNFNGKTSVQTPGPTPDGPQAKEQTPAKTPPAPTQSRGRGISR